MSQPQITDLDNVALLGNAALTAIPRWQAACAKFTGSFIPPLSREEAASLPDEQAQIDPDGGLSLVVTVRGKLLAMRAASRGMAVAPVTEKKPRHPDKYHIRVNGQAIAELKTHDRAQSVEFFRAEICAAMQAGRADTIAITRGGATVVTWPDPARNWDDPATFEALKQLRRGQPKLPPGSHRVRYLQLNPAQTQAALRHGETPEAGILAMLDAESNPT